MLRLASGYGVTRGVKGSIISSVATPFQIHAYRYRSKAKGRRLTRPLGDRDDRKGGKISRSVRNTMTPEELMQARSNLKLDEVQKESQARMSVRYAEPNKRWVQDTLELGFANDDSSYLDNNVSRSIVARELSQRYGAPKTKVKPIDIYRSELNVGDLVDISPNLGKFQLAVVIELPKDINDSRYTVLTVFGAVEFVSRSRMGFRIPKVFPPEWFKDCVYDETLFNKVDKETGTFEFTPIGKPRYNIEDDSDATKITFNALNPDSASHLLSSNISTYVVPSLLTGIISEELTAINNKAWVNLGNMNLKLEILHNVLQCSESPIHLTLFQLYAAVQKVDIRKLAKELVSTDPEVVLKVYKSLADEILTHINMKQQFDQISIGKSLMGELKIDTNLDIVELYTLMLSLRKNNQIYRHKNEQLYVTVIPLTFIVKFNSLVAKSKNDSSFLKSLSDYIAFKTGTSQVEVQKPEKYEDLIDLLKVYSASSFENPILESFVIKLIRSLPQFSQNDISKTNAYDLLMQLGEVSSTDDATNWWYDSLKPGTHISSKADLEQQYFDLVNEKFENNDLKEINDIVDLKYDRVAELRKDFEAPVYCIDDKSAAEIDDGISIERVADDSWIISILVADPASYLHPEDTLSEIAFERGSTLYSVNSTDQLQTIFPKKFVEKIHLIPNQRDPIRGLKISFNYNPVSKEVSSLKDISGEISFVNIKKIVTVSYSEVDSILAGQSGSERHDQTTIDDLKDLYNISEVLAKRETGSVTTMNNSINLKKQIKTVNFDKEAGTIKIVFNNGSTFDNVYENQKQFLSESKEFSKSRNLVAEHMIKANSISGSFFSNNNIPAIYKSQEELAKSDSIKRQLAKLYEMDTSDITPAHIALTFGYSTKAKFSPIANPHFTLKKKEYTTVTSPLRRFPDMINHWQLQSYLKKSSKLMFSQENINFQSIHLNNRDILNKAIMNRMSGFFIFRAFTELQKKYGNKISFKCYALNKPYSDGTVDVIMLNYNVRCILRTSWYGLDTKEVETERKHLSEIKVGDLIDDAVIEDVDMLDGRIILRTETY